VGGGSGLGGDGGGGEDQGGGDVSSSARGSLKALVDKANSQRPTLGLLWSHGVNCRLRLTRASSAAGASMRLMQVEFAPHLPSGYVVFMICDAGVQGLACGV
jgi:hypothetical protein